PSLVDDDVRNPDLPDIDLEFNARGKSGVPPGDSGVGQCAQVPAWRLHVEHRPLAKFGQDRWMQQDVCRPHQLVRSAYVVSQVLDPQGVAVLVQDRLSGQVDRSGHALQEACASGHFGTYIKRAGVAQEKQAPDMDATGRRLERVRELQVAGRYRMEGIQFQ